ncbi:MAG: hypothetical protein R3E73_13460 [Porticoccaceae bacterium]
MPASKTGSPSYVINGGRQTLYGNVGYRVLRANIDELLKQWKTKPVGVRLPQHRSQLCHTRSGERYNQTWPTILYK